MSDGTSLTLSLLPGRYAVCRLPADLPLPEWAGGPFVSITRSADELSVICDERPVPPDVRRESGFVALQVEGPIEFSVSGVLASLTAPLAAAGIPVLAVCTYDTDYLLVRDDTLDRAAAALDGAGHRLRRGPA